MLRRRPDAPASAPTDPARARLERVRGAGWVLPASLERDDVVPAWTRVGVVDGPPTATVDRRGLVTPHHGPGAVSLDWWIGAEDRWHAPARERGVVQQRLEAAPVLETVLRVPGGEVVHRAFGARGPARRDGDAWTVVEVENRSAVPVVLAWVLRPLTPTTVTGCEEIAVGPVDGSRPTGVQRITAGGAELGLLRRSPSRVAVATGGDDIWTAVTDGAAEEGLAAARGPLPTVALLTPVPHTATARLLLAAPDAPEAVDLDGLTWPDDLPSATAVARGWRTLVDQGPRVTLPDPLLAEAVEAARRSIRLSLRTAPPDGPGASEREVVLTSDTGADGPDPPGAAMELAAALAWWGDGAGVGRAVSRWPEAQERGGGFGDARATAAALEALAQHLVTTGDVGPASHWLPELGGALESLGRPRRRDVAEEVHVAAGLACGAIVLGALDQADAAGRVQADSLAASRRASVPDTVDESPGTATRAVAAAALARVRVAGDDRGLAAVLRRAEPGWSWSDADRWRGDDGLVTARLLRAVAEVLVADGPDGPIMVRSLPVGWWGLGWEVHDAPTRWGRLSYAVRWHGDRPALLWELDADVPGGPWRDAPVVLSIPGLDPTWSTDDHRGDALLAPVPRPDLVSEGPEAATTGAVAVAAPPRSVWRPQDPGPDAPSAPGGGDGEGTADGSTEEPGDGPSDGGSFL